MAAVCSLQHTETIPAGLPVACQHCVHTPNQYLVPMPKNENTNLVKSPHEINKHKNHEGKQEQEYHVAPLSSFESFV
jgi:hypothetical protein